MYNFVLTTHLPYLLQEMPLSEQMVLEAQCANPVVVAGHEITPLLYAM
jgi:hypothetical protein